MTNEDTLMSDIAFVDILSKSQDWIEAIEKSEKHIDIYGEILVYDCICGYFENKKIAS